MARTLLSSVFLLLKIYPKEESLSLEGKKEACGSIVGEQIHTIELVRERIKEKC